jgi:hypothetical protein
MLLYYWKNNVCLEKDFFKKGKKITDKNSAEIACCYLELFGKELILPTY